MKSGKQRRRELKARKQARREKRAAENAPHLEESGISVDVNELAPDGSYSVPDFVSRGYYKDQPFTCVDCGVAEVWTARQQKWWYEVAKGGVWTIARRCRPCRHRERDRRNEARRVHLEGLERKAQIS